MDLVLSMLRTVALQAFSDAEVTSVLNGEGWPEREGRWDESTALSALTRLLENKRIPTYDPSGGAPPPAWWVKHDQKRQKRIAVARESRRIYRDEFLKWFDSDTHALFEVKHGWTLYVDHSDEPFRIEDAEVESLATRLIAAHDDKTDLAKNALRALSVYAEQWKPLRSQEAVCVEALRLLDTSVLAAGVTQLAEDEEALGGLGRVLFGLSFAGRFSDDEWAETLPGVTEAVINHCRDDYWKLEPIAAELRRRGSDEAQALLKRMKSGEFSEKARDAAEEE